MSAHFKGLRALICLAAAAVLITGVTASVLAESQADDDNRLDEAWKDAKRRLKRMERGND